MITAKQLKEVADTALALRAQMDTPDRDILSIGIARSASGLPEIHIAFPVLKELFAGRKSTASIPAGSIYRHHRVESCGVAFIACEEIELKETETTKVTL